MQNKKEETFLRVERPPRLIPSRGVLTRDLTMGPAGKAQVAYIKFSGIHWETTLRHSGVFCQIDEYSGAFFCVDRNLAFYLSKLLDGILIE